MVSLQSLAQPADYQFRGVHLLYEMKETSWDCTGKGSFDIEVGDACYLLGVPCIANSLCDEVEGVSGGAAHLSSDVMVREQGMFFIFKIKHVSNSQ